MNPTTSISSPTPPLTPRTEALNQILWLKQQTQKQVDIIESLAKRTENLLSDFLKDTESSDSSYRWCQAHKSFKAAHKTQELLITEIGSWISIYANSGGNLQKLAETHSSDPEEQRIYLEKLNQAYAAEKKAMSILNQRGNSHIEKKE